MSYILDALRKSESDRYQEKLPELGGAAPIWLRKKKKNAVWPWIIAIALLINAVVLAYLFWPRQPSAVQTVADNLTLAAPVQPVTPSVQASTTPSADAVPAAPQSPAKQAMPVSTETRSVQQPLFEQAQPAFVRQPLAPLPDEDLAGSEPEEEVIIGPGYQVRPSSDAPVVAEPVEASSDEMTMAPVSEAESAPVEFESAPEETPDDIPQIEDLTAAEQQMIPALKFSSHIYSSNPESRRIVINQRYLREGQSVQGIRVVEITEEGVVLGVSGMVFRIPVLRDWSPDGR